MQTVAWELRFCNKYTVTSILIKCPSEFRLTRVYKKTSPAKPDIDTVWMAQSVYNFCIKWVCGLLQEDNRRQSYLNTLDYKPGNIFAARLMLLYKMDALLLQKMRVFCLPAIFTIKTDNSITSGVHRFRLSALSFVDRWAIRKRGYRLSFLLSHLVFQSFKN